MTSKLPINIEDLLRQRTVEGERIEYKAGWNPDAILRTLCAFANDFENLGGGYVVIGQDCGPDGLPIFPPVGLPDNQLDKIQRELLGYCKQIEPAYAPLLSLERVEGRNLLILWAPGGQTRPYKAPKSVTSKVKERHYFIRRYASTIEAKGPDELELISLAASVPFDDRLCQQADIEALSLRLIEDFLKDVGSALHGDVRRLELETLGRQMNIVGGSSERPLPRNVGLLFFSEAPERYFPATQIDVVWFPEGPGGDRFEEKSFKGPLGRMTRDALEFIDRQFLKENVLKRPDRAEALRFWNVPFPAIEEAVVNAVYHRSYEIREPVEVRISPDELLVLSYPGPDRSINMEDLKAGRAVSRRYRNRRIGEFLKELDLAEGRATGIPKILRVMAANGSPAPRFETDEDRSYFLIRLPVHPAAGALVGTEPAETTAQVTAQAEQETAQPTAQAAAQAGDSPPQVGNLPPQVTPQAGELPPQVDDLPPQATPQAGELPPQDGDSTAQATAQAGDFTPQAPPQVRRLVEVMDGEMTRSGVAALLGLRHAKHLQRAYLGPAIEQGFIERTVPEKPTSPLQKYRLTPKGHVLKNQLKKQGD